MTRRVLGIDPSLTATGIASSNGWVEVVGLAGHRGDDYPARCDRIRAVKLGVADLVNISVETSLAVIEGPSYGSKDPSFFDRAGLWWEVYRYCRYCSIPVAVVTPTQRMVYATGKGQAAKGAIIDAVARRWPQYETGGDDNAADAVVLMAMGCDWLGEPLTPMPATHRRALDKVAWPEVTHD